MHHKDMNRSNNARENIAIICRNCHELIHATVRRHYKLEDGVLPPAVFDEVQQRVGKMSMAESKARNEAGTPDGATRTEGCGEPQSGATHTGTSGPDMSQHEAAQAGDSNVPA